MLLKKIIAYPHKKLDYSDVLIVPQKSNVNSRSLVDLKTKYTFKYSKQTWEGVPLISANMDSVTNINTYRVLSKKRWLSCFPKQFNKSLTAQQESEMNINDMILSSGTNDFDILKQRLSTFKPKFVCIDIANGYIQDIIKTCNILREYDNQITIIAGNVVTPEGVQDLVKNGTVDIVKVGIGSGALCTTRKVTGVGYPQLSAILECSEAAHELGAHIIADGGIVNTGDISKAFVAGADFVMLGSMLAGHDISPGIKTIMNGDIYKHVYGMSSEHANNKHFGGLKDYKAAEGRSLKIPYKGCIERTIRDIEGGIRSACTYTGSHNIMGMRNAQFILVNNQYNKSLEKYDSSKK